MFSLPLSPVLSPRGDGAAAADGAVEAYRRLCRRDHPDQRWAGRTDHLSHLVSSLSSLCILFKPAFKYRVEYAAYRIIFYIPKTVGYIDTAFDKSTSTLTRDVLVACVFRVVLGGGGVFTPLKLGSCAT